ncbi:MAG: hypothetical protein SFU98_11085 [Leptospiraceae bacterium]|nr:hypothetical protein [Leptospiraceae bacterium]
MKLKFLVGFFLFGFILSMLCGIVAGNKITYILIVSLISAASFAAFGFGVFTFLERKVPEVIDFMEGVEMGYESGGDSEFYSEKSGYDSSNQFTTAESSGASSLGTSSFASSTESKRPQVKAEAGFLVVDNITIKNEPKLMAEAVRTMFAKDEMEGTSKSVQDQISKGK